METIELKLFSFEELNEEHKQQAIELARELESDLGYDYLDLYEVKEMIKEYGFENVDITYSGFCSQGDGLSFTGSLNVRKYLEENQNEQHYKYRRLLKLLQSDRDLLELTGEINEKNNRNMYVHEKTVYFTIDDRFNMYSATGFRQFDNIEKLINELEEDIEKDRLELCRKAYKALEKDYNSYWDDENMIETIAANDYKYIIVNNKIQLYWGN